jgi:cation:H+ antiporter
VARWEGALFVAYYLAYAVYVLLDAAGHDALGPYSEVMLGFVVPITVFWLGLLVAYEIGLRRGRGKRVP